MKILHYVAVLLAIITAAPAAAQTFTMAPEQGTYSPVAATYEAGTTINKLGNGVDANGGTAPAFTTHPEPADPTDNVDSKAWWYTVGNANNSSWCLSGVVGCEEKKFRFVLNSCPDSMRNDDPIRFWGQPGASHGHEFFGNCATNAFTTHLSLRSRLGVGVSNGGDMQLTAYWEPQWRKVIATKLYAMPADKNIGYYEEEAPAGEPIVDKTQALHVLFQFVGGVNPDDPLDTYAKQEIADANAQSGTSGRYQYFTNGFAGYVCLLPNGNSATVKGGGAHSPGFKLADGTDPWEGRCVAGSQIYAEANAPRCWDGVNTGSPGGWRHVRYEVRDTVINKLICPKGWFRVPIFQLKTMHRTQGWADYSTWSLASDAMMSAIVGYTVLPGASFHFDWKNGWHHRTLTAMLAFCLGVKGTPHACNDGVFDEGKKLIGNEPAPNGKRNPQVNQGLAYNTNDVSQLHLVDGTRASTIHIH